MFAPFRSPCCPGAMVCGECGRSIVLVSGRHGGYYGCAAARNEGCENRVKVPRLLAEKIIVDALQERLADPAAIQYVFNRLKKEIAGLSSDVPQSLRQMKAQLGNERRRRDNLVNFVAEGQGSDAIRDRLAQTEQKVSSLEVQIQELTRSSRGFRVPSLSTIERRCANLRALLDSSVAKSALVMRELLGKIRLCPVVSSSGRRYCVARTAFDTLKLLKDLDPDGGPDPGATSIGWWTTIAKVPNPGGPAPCCRSPRPPSPRQSTSRSRSTLWTCGRAALPSRPSRGTFMSIPERSRRRSAGSASGRRDALRPHVRRCHGPARKVAPQPAGWI